MNDKTAKLREYVETLEEIKKRKQYFHLEDFHPYAKQIEFFNAGNFRERMLSAGNQLGKSEAGAYEMAVHLSGLYPDWWMGRKFPKAITAWAAGVSAVVTRNVAQSKLFGKYGVAELLGTALIPKDKIVGDPSSSRAATDAFDTVHVRHKSGGISSVTFKSYEQGDKKFQGEPVDVIWLDEEADAAIYDECYARGNATGGMIYTTFTPLQGKTELVNRFWNNKEPKYRKLIRIKTSDCPFMTPEKIEANLAGTPTHQRAARMDGIPMQGSGNIFETEVGKLLEPRIEYVPESWAKLWAIDFGLSEGHNFAAALLLWDRDTDTIHVHDAYKMGFGTPLENAVKMKHIGILVPVAWPHDGWQKEHDGQVLADMYKKQGLRMCSKHATFEGGGYPTEAGILEMDQRMKTNRFKIANHLQEVIDEYNDYHRKDGQIVKRNDDLMSAIRIGVMAKREGRPVLLGSKRPDPRMNGGNYSPPIDLF